MVSKAFLVVLRAIGAVASAPFTSVMLSVKTSSECVQAPTAHQPSVLQAASSPDAESDREERERERERDVAQALFNLAEVAVRCAERGSPAQSESEEPPRPPRVRRPEPGPAARSRTRGSRVLTCLDSASLTSACCSRSSGQPLSLLPGRVPASRPTEPAAITACLGQGAVPGLSTRGCQLLARLLPQSRSPQSDQRGGTPYLRTGRAPSQSHRKASLSGKGRAGQDLRRPPCLPPCPLAAILWQAMHTHGTHTREVRPQAPAYECLLQLPGCITFAAVLRWYRSRVFEGGCAAADAPVPVCPTPLDPESLSHNPRGKLRTCAYHVHIAHFISEEVRKKRWATGRLGAVHRLSAQVHTMRSSGVGLTLRLCCRLQKQHEDLDARMMQPMHHPAPGPGMDSRSHLSGPQADYSALAAQRPTAGAAKPELPAQPNGHSHLPPYMQMHPQVRLDRCTTCQAGPAGSSTQAAMTCSLWQCELCSMPECVADSDALSMHAGKAGTPGAAVPGAQHVLLPATPHGSQLLPCSCSSSCGSCGAASVLAVWHAAWRIPPPSAPAHAAPAWPVLCSAPHLAWYAPGVLTW